MWKSWKKKMACNMRILTEIKHIISFFLCIHCVLQMFPALRQLSYRSILLRNTGDLPLIFKLTTKDCPDVSVLPSSGLVRPGSHQILILRSTPAEENQGSLPLTLQLNASPKHTQVHWKVQLIFHHWEFWSWRVIGSLGFPLCLGTKHSVCGGEAMHHFGGWRQLVFEAHSSGLLLQDNSEHQEL